VLFIIYDSPIGACVTLYSNRGCLIVFNFLLPLLGTILFFISARGMKKIEDNEATSVAIKGDTCSDWAVVNYKKHESGTLRCLPCSFTGRVKAYINGKWTFEPLCKDDRDPRVVERYCKFNEDEPQCKKDRDPLSGNRYCEFREYLSHSCWHGCAY
jgi:hypothetical protein